MFNERAFIARVEAAGTDELARILAHPTTEEEKALRAHLGDQRYQRMHSMALKRSASRAVAAPSKGNIVVIHGIMGGELTVSNQGGPGDLTWVSVFRIIRGWLDRLRLDASGRHDFDPRYKVRATGIMKRYYGELLLSLSENWNVHPFWFDWRKDLVFAADELNLQISGWFGDKAPVHLVAHSMGGLVARTFIKKYSDRWNAMWDRPGNGRAGGRLVMLGTPNHGSFAIPQVMTGIEDLVIKLGRVDLRHSREELLETFNSFVGSYQMLPSPLVLPAIKDLYNAGTYSGFNVNVSQQHLDTALQHHNFLSDVVDTQRMIYVAGYDQPTFSGIRDFRKLNSIDGYEATMNGDGRVPHQLGLLKARDGRNVPTYYIKEDHGDLSANPRILRSLDDLLATGQTTLLDKTMPANRSAQESPAAQKKARELLAAAQAADEARLQISIRRMGAVRSAAPEAVSYVSPEERKVEENITRGYLSSGDDEMVRVEERVIPAEIPEIEIGLEYGGIESINYESIKSRKGDPVDALSVGQYIGVKPQAAMKALDQAISYELHRRMNKDAPLPEQPDWLLTQYIDRGIIRGELGQPFFLTDPRQANGKHKGPDRIIAIAGMDEPGLFGVPELTVLVRELCWALGRLGQRHLATVLIGAGNGNIPTPDAIAAWMRGIRRAIAGSKANERARLQRITFVELDPRRIPEVQDAILKEVEWLEKNQKLKVDFQGLSDARLAELKKEEPEWDRRDRDRGRATDQEADSVPTRVTLKLEQKTYRFGAITDTASVPEREITLDPSLVMRANDELAGELEPEMQLERGQFLEQLLIPDDLRRQLYNKAPLVMMLDATTARIHWEMVAQPGLATPAGGVAEGEGAPQSFEYEDYFLGTTRGLTRQLRTAFAPPPEPPPPPRRVLRVLVVADPAEDAHLPGAQEEGVAVADLCESFNEVYQDSLQDNRIEVVRLFGPLEATRTNVLRELMVRTYDVLHFAGHCVYRWDGDPAASGWIFNEKRRELLSASELHRIDRVPKFVFSNACESGVTPDRSGARSVALAPSFAEAFFARGVANFVCTAWPVDDIAARQFALTLYAGLLGLKRKAQGSGYEADAPKAMHQAMRAARLAVASTQDGRNTWGAYQHYGNPYLRFFSLLPVPDQSNNGKAAREVPDATTKRAPGSASRKRGSGKKGALRSAKKSKK